MLFNESLLFAHVCQGSAHARGTLYLCRAEENLRCERAKAGPLTPSDVCEEQAALRSQNKVPGELIRYCHVGQLMF